ncbi:hypothetical protein [Kordia sp.]|uniref:hypothetical protein n=1 Tax=Kordia sp. TaxID=1965332 RepID=UPI003D6C462D
MIATKENLLNNYPAFRYLNWMKKIGIHSIPAQNLILTLFFVITITISSYLDQSYLLDKPNIGLFQHPVIWFFFIIQVLIPFALNTSITRFLNMSNWKHSIIKVLFFKDDFTSEVQILNKNTLRKKPLSKSFFALLLVFGFISFVWNSYQNQSPLRFVGFDFWDSYTYPFGYWATRIYKLYMWCIFFPSIIHLYCLLVIQTLSVLKRSYNLNMLALEPYHYDGNGGVSVFIKNIITPIIPVLLATSLLSVSVYLVHQKFDFTTISSLVISTVFFLVLYFIPAFKIGKIIRDNKEEQLAEIAKKQKKFLDEIVDARDIQQTKNNFELITTFEEITKKIKSIPNWPNYKFVTKIIALAYSPTLILGLIRHYFLDA